MGNIFELGKARVEAPKKIDEVPEFSKDRPDNTVEVPVGTYRSGGISRQFFSMEFDGCSCIILRDPSEKNFFYWHVLPGQEPTDNDYKKLDVLKSGSACHIVGSHSTPKTRFINGLFEHLCISLTNIIDVETRGNHTSIEWFHAAFRPAANLIIVARPSFEDVLTFTAFK